MKLQGEQLRQAWDELTKTKTKEQVAVLITKTDSYWDYIKRYEPSYPAIPFSEIPPEEIAAIESPDIVQEEAHYQELKSNIYSHLTPIQIQIVEMRESGHSYNEISHVLGKKSGAVRQIMRRVRNKLKKAMYNDL